MFQENDNDDCKKHLIYNDNSRYICVALQQQSDKFNIWKKCDGPGFKKKIQPHVTTTIPYGSILKITTIQIDPTLRACVTPENQDSV